jgi:hypothetical protein
VFALTHSVRTRLVASMDEFNTDKLWMPCDSDDCRGAAGVDVDGGHAARGL